MTVWYEMRNEVWNEVWIPLIITLSASETNVALLQAIAHEVKLTVLEPKLY